MDTRSKRKLEKLDEPVSKPELTEDEIDALRAELERLKLDIVQIKLDHAQASLHRII